MVCVQNCDDVFLTLMICGTLCLFIEHCDDLQKEIVMAREEM